MSGLQYLLDYGDLLSEYDLNLHIIHVAGVSFHPWVESQPYSTFCQSTVDRNSLKKYFLNYLFDQDVTAWVL